MNFKVRTVLLILFADLMIQATDIANIQKDLLSQSKKIDSIQKRLPGKGLYQF